MVHNGKDADLLVVNRVDKRVRKTAHNPSPYSRFHLGPSLRVLADFLDRGLDDVQEICPQGRNPAFVIGGRLDQFLLSRGKKAHPSLHFTQPIPGIGKNLRGGPGAYLSLPVEF